MIPDSCNVRGSALCHAEPVELSCVIVDDSVEFLEAARSFLEREGLRVVGVVASGHQAVERLRELRPQVVLVDIDLGRESGFEIARRIERSVPTSVILISTHAEDDYAELIAQSPVAGFISKPKLSGQAIQCLLAGPAGDGASATPGT
jgi:two-component system nitrate/nitrite response regulator NarL